MGRRVVVAALLSLVFAAEVRAQERIDFTAVDMTAAMLNSTVIPAVPLSDIDQFPVPPVQRLSIRRTATTALLSTLYASTAVMQALDAHSTFRALDNGAVEANPLMTGLARNRAAFVAVKALVATTTILATRQMARRSKLGAVVTIIALNSAYAMIVRHNYNIARGH